jgi:hypothetical protein
MLRTPPRSGLESWDRFCYRSIRTVISVYFSPTNIIRNRLVVNAHLPICAGRLHVRRPFLKAGRQTIRISETTRHPSDDQLFLFPFVFIYPVNVANVFRNMKNLYINGGALTVCRLFDKLLFIFPSRFPSIGISLKFAHNLCPICDGCFIRSQIVSF